jgi:hypothetical protein
MYRIFAIIFSISTAILIAGCSAEPETNTGITQSANVSTVEANALPEGLDPKPIDPSNSEIPGIPANPELKPVPKGGSPAEGIPAPEDAGKPLKPGATPTPGIPSEEELRKMMNRPATNGSISTAPTNSASQTPNRKQPRPVGEQDRAQ